MQCDAGLIAPISRTGIAPDLMTGDPVLVRVGATAQQRRR